MRKQIILIIVILMLASLACASSTSTQAVQATKAAPAQSASGLIEKVVMAEDTQGELLDPVNPTTEFKADAVFHAVVAIKDAPADTKFKASWFVVDVGSAAEAGQLIDSSELTADGTRNLDFTLSPKDKWPSGTYKVEIAVNGVKEAETTFSVK